VAGDIYRPAAIEQLKVLAQQIDVSVYSEEDNKDPVKIVKASLPGLRVPDPDATPAAEKRGHPPADRAFPQSDGG
jgi:signal recognition particle GTPase